MFRRRDIAPAGTRRWGLPVGRAIAISVTGGPVPGVRHCSWLEARPRGRSASRPKSVVSLLLEETPRCHAAKAGVRSVAPLAEYPSRQGRLRVAGWRAGV